MAKNDAEYENWVKDVRGKLPAEEVEAFDKLTSGVGGRQAFSGHLTEKTFYTRLNELNAEKQKVQEDKDKWSRWFYEEAQPQFNSIQQEKADLQARIEKLTKAFVAGDEPAPEPKETVSPNNDEVRALKEQFQAFDQFLPALLGDSLQVAHKIANEKWKVDPKDVLKHALTNKVTLDSAFNALTAKEREERSNADMEKRLRDAEEKGRREAMSKAHSPDRLTASGPSILDTIRKGTPQNAQDRVSDAVTAFLDIPAEQRTGSGL